jgi:hypothetical protein
LIGTETGIKPLLQCTANVRYGSLADKPSPAKIHLCPLWSESGQIVAVPRVSALCHSRLSLRCSKAARYFTIAHALPDGTHVPVEEPSAAS